ncbi:MAG: NAD-dependent epimerase/dehydratase family protein [Bacteroidota bacterium]
MIFVTGGTGFIGAHLLMHLAEEGQQIRAFKRGSSSTAFFEKLLDFYGKPHLSSRIEWHDGSLDDVPGLVAALEGCDTVYHCAGKVSFAEKDWPELLKTNRDTTANLVNASIEAGSTTFCLFSSVAALDMSLGIKGKKTDWKAFRKHQPYGYSKYLGELEVYRGHEEGLNVVVLNPAVVIGASDETNPLSRFVARMRRGMKFYPSGSTGFVSVELLCRLAIDATRNASGQTRITVCSDNLGFKTMMEKFSAAAGTAPPKQEIKGGLFFAAYLAAWIIRFVGIRSELSVSGLRAMSSQSSYDTAPSENYKAFSLDKAIQEAVSFTA